MILTTQSTVEKEFLKESGHPLLYSPAENLPIVQVSNFPALGQLTALRFIEWLQFNPEGVISLPTGKTPEYFIKFVEYYTKNWNHPKVRTLIEKMGLNTNRKPNFSGIQFVQIDEFYPIMPTQHNSFHSYVKKYYLKGFGIPEDRAQLIDSSSIPLAKGKPFQEIFPNSFVDLSLRFRQAKGNSEMLQKESIERIDQWCSEYEEQVVQKGGIGFFLGGIGPDGHIAFNVRGSDYFSTTRLTPTNFETQAAAAGDLGGIDVSRTRLVITIGLKTITYKNDATAIIFAAGEAKAGIVADAVQNKKSNTRPASALQGMPNARFYITAGASKYLTERQLQSAKSLKIIPNELIEKVLIDRAFDLNKKVADLTDDDMKQDQLSAYIMQNTKKSLKTLAEGVEKNIQSKLNRGLAPDEGETFLHTAPHHDDIMLGYLAHLVHLVRTPKNTHHFAYLTSGFNAVTNEFVIRHLDNVLAYLKTDECVRLEKEHYFSPEFSPGNTRDVYNYLNGIAARSKDMIEQGEARRMIRILLAVFPYEDMKTLATRIEELKHYFRNQYPGQKDLPHVQSIKGQIREWEADLVWGHYGIGTENVHHLRLGFYKGDIFTEEPTVNRDVMPILRLMEKTKPTIVTLALDPEASGPDTHYKVLQAVSEAIRIYKERHPKRKLKVWGYRNVWFRFHPTEANIYVPVSLNSMSILKDTFDNCFVSQNDAPFPSYEHDGTFAELAQSIHVEQHQKLKTIMGSDFWYQNEHPRLRAAHGVQYIKEMELEEFYSQARALREITEVL